MALKRIVAPIIEDLNRFNKKIKDFVEGVGNEKVKANYKVFFDQEGKHLRPILLYLSTGTIKRNRSNFDEGLDRLALIFELIHSASLVHDDIIDEDVVRRGQETINQVFGNKIAVLAGDTLFTYAFREVTKYFESTYATPITNLALNMCMAELEQANGIDDKEAYLKMIQGKTADFMAVCCELGARYAGAKPNQVDQMKAIGLNIGMTYQLIDDQLDSDPNALKYASDEDVNYYYNQAVKLMDQVQPSVYLTSFRLLLDYIMAMPQNKKNF